MKRSIADWIAFWAVSLLIFIVPATCAADKTITLSASVRLPVRFTVPGKGLASLAVYDANGVLVRSLLNAQAVEAGQHTTTWDATTDLGLPVTPGTYQVKGIFFTAPPSLKYVMKVGKSGSPPWRTPDGTGDWGGNLGGPSAICANSRSLVMAWSCVEDNQITGVQQMDKDGNVQLRYFTFYPWDSRCAGAIDESNFYPASASVAGEVIGPKAAAGHLRSRSTAFCAGKSAASMAVFPVPFY